MDDSEGLGGRRDLNGVPLTFSFGAMLLDEQGHIAYFVERISLLSRCIN